MESSRDTELGERNYTWEKYTWQFGNRERRGSVPTQSNLHSRLRLTTDRLRAVNYEEMKYEFNIAILM